MRYICTAVVATLALAGTSFAATINVPGDHATIQGAINASSHGDVIAIAAGTYNEHSIDTDGKAITIGSASGNLDVTIDANGGGSVFRIESGETSGTVIKDLVITGGLANYGGGIYCGNSSPTISGCTIEGNTTNDDGEGGGIYCEDSSPTITNCTISGNMATGSQGNGGGIYCDNSEPTISGCTISGNTAHYSGGGISCYGSEPTISNCTISGNTAFDGGGISCYGSWPTTTISDCTISGNTAYYGGGISCYGTYAAISDCTIEGNTANFYGGGAIYSEDSSPTITGCTFTSNMPNTIFGDITLGGSPSTTGACCVSSGCHALTEDACAGMGGTWLGEDASCDDCPASCMGDTDGNGVVNIEDLLNMLGSWGACP